MSSVSIPTLASICFKNVKGAGSATEPDQSSASEAARDILSSSGSSSDPPNETRSFAMAEGHWSGQENETGETSLGGGSEVLMTGTVSACNVWGNPMQLTEMLCYHCKSMSLTSLSLRIAFFSESDSAPHVPPFSSSQETVTVDLTRRELTHCSARATTSLHEPQHCRKFAQKFAVLLPQSRKAPTQVLCRRLVSKALTGAALRAMWEQGCLKVVI